MTDITYHLPVPRISPWLSSSTITIPNLRSISQGVFELALRPATGQEAPGIQTKSSLETFWKMWHLVYKAEVGQGFNSMTFRQINYVNNMFAGDLDTLTAYRC
jgi:hypothetical protein